MANYDAQKKILDAISVVVKAEMEKQTTTNSIIGFVIADPIGFDCTVNVGGQEYACQVPEHLHSWIQKDDIVIIQDLYGDGSKKVVTGKTGSRNASPSLVFYDESVGKNVSGVDVVYDEMGNVKMDTFGTVTEVDI